MAFLCIAPDFSGMPQQKGQQSCPIGREPARIVPRRQAFLDGCDDDARKNVFNPTVQPIAPSSVLG
jgi:hypothetical protein